MDYILSLFNNLRTIFITLFIGLAIYYLINIGNRYVEKDRKFIVTKKQVIHFISIGFVIFISYYIYKTATQLTELLMPVLYSVILAYLLNPLINTLEKKGISRGWSIIGIYLVIATSIFLISISLFPKIAQEFENLIKVLPSYFNKAYVFLNGIYEKYSKSMDNLPIEFQTIDEVVKENLNEIQLTLITYIKSIANTIINMFSRIFTFVIIPIFTFYFLKDKEYFRRKIYLTIPKAYRCDVGRIAREIDIVLGKFIRGQLIIATFIGSATAIALLILGIDFAFIIGLIAGIADVIPYFGPIIGIIPALIFALLDKPIKAIWVIIAFVIIQQIESNILAPKIVGDSVGLHPIIVIIALLIGGSFFGIIGMLLAVPVAAIIKITSAFIIEKLTKA